MQLRVGRAAAIHGMARFAAIMASTYKAYLGEGLGPLEALTQLRIPHPGRVTGQIILKLTMVRARRVRALQRTLRADEDVGLRRPPHWASLLA